RLERRAGAARDHAACLVQGTAGFFRRAHAFVARGPASERRGVGAALVPVRLAIHGLRSRASATRAVAGTLAGNQSCAAAVRAAGAAPPHSGRTVVWSVPRVSFPIRATSR